MADQAASLEETPFERILRDHLGRAGIHGLRLDEGRRTMILVVDPARKPLQQSRRWRKLQRDAAPYALEIELLDPPAFL